MTTVNATGSTGAPQQAAPTVQPGTLGKDDFMKLLLAQLRHQDPLSPMDNMQYMGQLAQFSAIEQLANLRSDLGRLTHAGQVSQGVGLIGKTVGFVRGDGSAAEGVVESIRIVDGEIRMSIGGDEIVPADVRSIR